MSRGSLVEDLLRRRNKNVNGRGQRPGKRQCLVS